MNVKTRIHAMLKTNKKLGQRGFTLLELLVVVAILAAVAGTASIALRDTDARASAAAHVAMMDELNKGVGTYRVLNKNQLPTRLDSLLQFGSGTTVATAEALSILGFDDDEVAVAAIPDAVQDNMAAAGIDKLLYVNTTLSAPDGAYSCSDIESVLQARNSNLVAGNVFLSPSANGCGQEVTFGSGTIAANGMFWKTGSERLTGQPNNAGAGSLFDAAGNYAYLMTGIGPGSSLFDANRIGAMTTVPVYRHVKPTEYNRFIAVWNVGTYGTAGAITAAPSPELVAIIDGALDTKEEELGEWDGTRNTI